MFIDNYYEILGNALFSLYGYCKLFQLYCRILRTDCNKIKLNCNFRPPEETLRRLILFVYKGLQVTNNHLGEI